MLVSVPGCKWFSINTRTSGNKNNKNEEKEKDNNNKNDNNRSNHLSFPASLVAKLWDTSSFGYSPADFGMAGHFQAFFT